MDLWKKHCIYKVPAYMKDESPKAYTPQVLSIGPYHHGQIHLSAMEGHKDRALQRFLQRTSKSYDVYCETLRPLTPDLMDSYQQLSTEWRNQPEAFLWLMIRDGSFLYEFLRGLSQGWDYDPLDPVFSFEALLKSCAYIVPDILMIENQLPLKVIERLIAVEDRRLNDENVEKTHELVFKFLSSGPEPFPNNMSLGLHVLDVSRKVMSKEVIQQSNKKQDFAGVVKSASELYDAGVRFRKSGTQDGSGISFADGILKLPLTRFDSSTEPLLLNAIAFELFHPTAGFVVSSYIAFMQGFIKSTSDVSILVAEELFESTIGGDEVVAIMKRISKNVFFDSHSNLCEVRDLLNQYHAEEMKSRMKQLRRQLREWGRQLHQIYFSSPWSIISIFAATILLVLTLIQTIYSVRSYNVSGRGN